MMEMVKKLCLVFVMLALAGCTESNSLGAHNTHGAGNEENTEIGQSEYGVRVAPGGVQMVQENHGSVSVEISLSSKPSADVTIQLRGSSIDDAVLDHSIIVFSPQDWDKPQSITVQAVDNDIFDGNRVFAISFDVTSDDANYHQLAVEPIEIVVVDDDDVIAHRNSLYYLTEEILMTDEYGTRDYIMFQLSNRPAYDVTVMLESLDPDEAMPEFSYFVIEPDNWTQVIEIPVHGLDDGEDDGDSLFRIKVSSITSKDPSISDQAVNMLTEEISNEIVGWNIARTDDSGPQIIARQMTDWNASGYEPRSGYVPQGMVSEDGKAFVEFEVSLSSKPIMGKPVEVTGSLTDTAEGRLEPQKLTFDENNWNQPQKVRVYGVDDKKIDGDVYFGLKFISSSLDLSKNGIESDDIILVNVDNDLIETKGGGEIINAEGTVVIRKPYDVLYTNESGSSKYIYLSLNHQPVDDVKVYFESSDETEGKIVETSNIFHDEYGSYILFDALSWNTEQKLMIQGQDDDEADGNQTYYVNFATSSRDVWFNQLDVPAVELYNFDDETTNENDACTSFSQLFNVSGNLNELNVFRGDVQTVWISLACKPSTDVRFRATNAYPAFGCVRGGNDTLVGCSDGGGNTVVLEFSRDDYKTPKPVYLYAKEGIEDGSYLGVNIKPNIDIIEGMDPLFADFNPLKVKYQYVSEDSSSNNGNESGDPNQESPHLVFKPNICSLAGTVTAEGKSQVYYVHLSAQPKNDVEVRFTIPAEYQNLLGFKNGKDKLDFTTVNFDVDQAIEIVSKNENVNDTAVIHYEMTSGEPKFNNNDISDEDACYIKINHLSNSAEITPTTPRTRKIRIMTANTTTGNKQRYEEYGMRGFYAMDPDIILIQEFKNSAENVVALLEEHFKTDYHYYVFNDDENELIPDDEYIYRTGRITNNISNGIITKGDLKIIKGYHKNSAVDTIVDRGYDAVIVDLPGEKDLLAFSLHLSYNYSISEHASVRKMAETIQMKENADFYYAIGGDLNIGANCNSKRSHRNHTLVSSLISEWSNIVSVDVDYPEDQNHNCNTNRGRNSHYDWLLVDSELQENSVPVKIGNVNYPNGYVLDSRVQNPLSDISPVEYGDSNALNMQHEAVVRDFIIQY